MNTQTTPTPHGLTVGASTEQLLQALRYVEQARACYIDALERYGGIGYADDMTNRADGLGPILDKARDLIQREITDRVEMWAEANEEKPEI